MQSVATRPGPDSRARACIPVHDPSPSRGGGESGTPTGPAFHTGRGVSGGASRGRCDGVLPGRIAVRAEPGIAARSLGPPSRLKWEFAAMVNVEGEIPLVGRVETPDADVPLVMDDSRRTHRSAARGLDRQQPRPPFGVQGPEPLGADLSASSLGSGRRAVSRGSASEGRQIRPSGPGRGFRSPTAAG